MLRADLISSLETVKPALAINQLIPVLTHFWFTGKRLMAFNDQIAISIPFEADPPFKGAVSSKLLELLRVKDGGANVEVVDDGRGNLVVQRLSRRNENSPLKPGKGKIRLAMLNEEFIFKMPVPERVKTKNDVMTNLIDGMAHCLISVGSDTSAAEHLGVTFEKDPDNDRRIVLYSTDSQTICRAYLQATNSIQLPHRAIVPGLFCEQMLRLYRAMSEQDRKNGKASFQIASRQVREGVTDRYALFTAGSAILYGRLLETRSPFDFADVLGHHLPKEFERQLLPFPPKLRGAIERAFIVCDATRKSVELKVEAGKLHLMSMSDNEEVKDEVLFKSHDNITANIEPRFLRRASSSTDFDQLLVAPLCIVMAKRDRGMLYLVSTR